MDQLSDVHSCLRALDSSKVTDRKKNVTRLLELLEKKSVIEVLDANTKQSQSSDSENRQITWNVVLKGINRYIETEISVLQSAKESQSSTTQSNREKKKRELAAQFKTVVKVANQRGAKLKWHLILDSILSVLRDEYTLEAMGAEYSSVLLKSVLRIRQYWLEIPAKQWRKLLSIFCKLYEMESLDRVLVTHIVLELCQGNVLQGEIMPQKVFHFFTRVMENHRQLKAPSVIENILTSLNIFCNDVAPNNRAQLCHFGESQMDAFVFLWGKASTEKIKEELIVFLHLLIGAHHPAGVSDPEQGAYVPNRDLWKNQLTSLHEMIVTDIDDVAGRYKFSSSSKVTTLKSNYIRFAADIFKQMPLSKLVHSDLMLSSTQTSQPGNYGDRCTSGPSKRLRVSTENKSLLEIIRDRSNTLQAIPWLQILHCLLEGYPGWFNSENLAQFLELTEHLLAECKRGQLFPFLFEVLSSLLKTIPNHWNLGKENDHLVTAIWSNCVSTINSRQAEIDGYQDQGLSAMAAIISAGLMIPRKEIWNFFLPNFSRPSLASVKLLISLVSSHGLPENYTPSIVGVAVDRMSGDQSPNFPLRQSLLAWLLPVNQTYGHTQTKIGLTPFIVANLVFSLTLQDPSDLNTNSVDEDVDASQTQSEMETVYLKTTFDHWSQQPSNIKITNNRKSAIPQSSQPISAMLHFLVGHLKKFLEHFDPLVQNLDHQAWLSAFLTRLLYLLGETNSVGNEVLQMMKKTVEKCAMDFIGHLKKEGVVGLLSPLATLSQLLVWGDKSHLRMFWIAEVVRSCLPAAFVDVLIDIACGKMDHRKDLRPSSPRAHHSRSHVFSDNDWGSVSTSWSGVNLTHRDGTCHNNGQVTDGMTGLEFNGEDSQKQSVFSKDVSDYMRKDNLSEGQQIRLLCVEILCQLTSFDKRLCRDWPEWLSVTSGMDIDHVKGKLLSLISSMSCGQTINLHLLARMTKDLLTKEHHVTYSNIRTILSAFKPIAREMSQDQLACCVILSSLSHLVPHLGHSEDLPPEELKYCRDVFFKFISNFWILASEGIPKLKLELVKVLMDLLKHDPYSTWGHLRIKATEEDGTFDLCIVGRQFPKLLQEENVLVRNLVAESLTWLFVKQGQNGAEISMDQSIQTQVFDSVFMLCSELLNQQMKPKDISQPEKEDEITNARAGCLQALLTIMSSSPVCEKQCLLALCQMVAYQDIPTHLAKKVLKIISHKLKYPSVQSYLSCHMSYLVHNWLNEDMMNSPITELPVHLLEFKDMTKFVRSCQDLIVSETLITKLSSDDVLSSLPGGLDLHKVLISALPGTLVHILPFFAIKSIPDVSENPSVIKKHDVRAGKCYNLLKQHLQEKQINECVCEKLGDIVVKILTCLSLKEENMDNESMVYPEPNPPCYNQQVIRTTLDFLAQNFTVGDKGSKVTLISVLAKVPDGLHQVLLSLSILFWKEHRDYERLRLLKMYGLFVGMLLRELDQGLEGGWAAVIRDVFNRLLILLEDRAKTSDCVSSPSYEEETILTGLDVLHNVCNKALLTCPDEMANYIHRTVDTVSSLVSQSQAISQSAMALLTTVTTAYREESDDLTNAMRMLNPVPHTPGLEELRIKVESLSGEEGIPLAERFSKLLKVLSLMAHTPSQGLTLRINQLTDYIVHNHEELKDMARHTEYLSQLRKVILELVRMISSPCCHLASSSASCLGAIGPVDLQTLSMSWQLNETSQTLASELYRNHEMDKYCWLFHTLDRCLLDENLEVVRTAGQILKDVMATNVGAKFESDYTTRMKDDSFLFHYLHPYKGSSKKMAPPPPPIQIDLEAFRTIDRSELWLGKEEGSNLSHGKWITNLTTSLLQTGAVTDEILRKISPMCLLKVKFCEESLPFLIHDILKSGVEEYRRILSSHFSSFFQSHCQAGLVFQEGEVASSVFMNRDCVLTMLNVVQYLRKQDRPKDRQNISQTAWDNNFWLDINYLEISKAANNCLANFTAVLFAEIWWNNCKIATGDNSTTDNLSPLSQSQGSSLDPLTLLSSQGEAGHGIQTLLLKAYRSIGDPDGIYGCGAGKLAEPMARVQTYLHENQQEKALTTLDIEVSHNPSASIIPFLQTIQSCGTDFILQRCLQGADSNLSDLSTSSSKELEEFRYKVAWTLGQWEVNLPTKPTSSAPFHQSVFKALVSLRDGHLQVAREAVESARLYITKSFEPGLESCRSLYPVLCQLQCLTHLDQVLMNFDILKQGQYQSPSFQDVQKDSFISNMAVDFDFEKPLLHLLTTLGKVLADKGIEQGQTLELNSLWNLAVGGRKAKQFQLAEKALAELQTKVKDTMSALTSKHLQLEEAKLFWSRCESNIAINVLKDLIGQLKKVDSQSTSPSLYPEALGYYGNWLAETRSETPTVIISDYLEKTVELTMTDMSNCEIPTRTSVEAFVSLARFADEQYQQIADYMRSPTYEDKRNLLKRSKSELESCREFKNQNIKYLKVMEKNSQIDQQEMESLEEDHRRYLLQAFVNYIRCLGAGNMFNLKMFRLVALWFDNCHNEEINKLMEEAVRTVTSFKFLPLIYQLAARMSSKPSDDESFQLVLNQLMEKVARDHPHHAMWIILALAHAYKDDLILAKDQTSRKRGKLSTGETEIAEADRVQAAKDLVEKLKTGGKKMGDLVGKMERLCEAYIELANWKVPNERDRRPQPLPKSLAIMKLSNLNNILLPSIELAVDPSCSYDSLISPVRFATDFTVIGGINLPKIIKCHGSDGIERTQLVKGKDDLRQDAVMQQVFSLVNQLLEGDEETKQRHLSIRTYKVIPLSQKCGLLQWCDGTQPLGEYLIGTTRTVGAHSRYRPRDWFFKECRDHLNKAGNRADNRFKAYQEICSHFKPVLHHFFLEKFLEPSVWFEKRLAYTRSVATNSIVGYILGLGDRHLMNILIDLQTAELVHIDLGIAFEQGQILPTPETVPFRLTRDIVDGMGVTGVEGVFRRCCEKTMHVMKNNSESLLTIVQVLLYDPLSHWSLTPQQTLVIQRKRDQANLDTLDTSIVASGQVPSSGQISTGSLAGSSDLDMAARNKEMKEHQNKLAERALLRLKQKLCGQEDGASLSVPGQVNLLIQKASDPRNLCKLFAGWQPYL